MLVKITDQGTEFEFTVVQKLNPGIGSCHTNQEVEKAAYPFPGSFLIFLEKQKSKE